MTADEKTEKTTPERRQDKRKEGNMFQSSNVAAVYSMLVMSYVSKVLTSRICRNFRQGICLFFSYGENPDRFLAQLDKEVLTKAIMLFLETALPLLFIGVLVAVAVTFFQTRMAFSMDVLKFKGERISPLKEFKGMMLVGSMVELIKALIKITILGWVAYDFLGGRMKGLAVLMEGSVESALIFTENTVISLASTVGVAFVFLAALDCMYQWREYEKNLRVSRREIREEYEQTKGDPQIEGRIREKQCQMASRRMVQNVSKADVIIRSPTHYVIALGYDSSQSRTPVVLAKGADHLALKVMETGKANGAYILGDRPLVRGLYAGIEANMEIPEEYYQAVVGILAFVYKLSKKDI